MPFHGDTHPSFHTLPAMPHFKDGWRCFGCGEGGDEFDFLMRIDPVQFGPGRYAARLTYLADLRREYEALAYRTLTVSNLRGSGSKSMKKPEANDQFKVGVACADFDLDLKRAKIDRDLAYRVLGIALENCASAGVSMEAVLRYERDFEDWKKETDGQHLAECYDADCEARVCRKARVLPPLEEMEATRNGRF